MLCVFSVVALFDALLVQFWQLVRLVLFVKFREFDFFFFFMLLTKTSLLNFPIVKRQT